MIERKIYAMEKHQKFYEKRHGTAWYEDKMAELLDQLLACDVPEDEPDTITARPKDDGDDEDDNGNTGYGTLPLPALPGAGVAGVGV